MRNHLAGKVDGLGVGGGNVDNGAGAQPGEDDNDVAGILGGLPAGDTGAGTIYIASWRTA